MLRAWANRACPAALTLSRAFSEGAAPGLLAHVQSCPRCRGEWEALAHVQQVAREVPVVELRDDAFERVRESLLHHRAMTAPPLAEPRGNRLGQLGWRLGAVAAAALLALLLLSLRPWRSPEVVAVIPAEPHRIAVEPARRGDVAARGRAVFERLGDQPDELVRLSEGTVSVRVQPLAAGERFRVMTADGEVEVRGTAFEVVARGDRLTAVAVSHGLVEVRPRGHAPLLLGAGERWDSTAPDEIKSIEAASAPGVRAHPVHRRLIPRRSALAPSENPADSYAEREFGRGWTALKAQQAGAAAESFDRAAQSAAAHPLAVDARFWQGIALLRAGQMAEARSALELCITQHPDSPRAGEASAALGGLLLEMGDLAGAETSFQTAARDRVDAVRSAGLRGLAAIARKRVPAR